MKILASFILILLLLFPAAPPGGSTGSEYGVSPLLPRSIAQHDSGMKPATIYRNRNGTYDTVSCG